MKSIPLSNYSVINELMVLINRYINRTKYISPHSDNESALLSTAVGAICFGSGIRIFRI